MTGYNVDLSREGTRGILFVTSEASTYTTVKGVTAAVIWRYRNVSASVLAGGLSGTVKPAQAAALARAQQAHVAGALS